MQLEDFDVLEKHQKKGYGSKILGEIKKYGSEQGVKILFLQVESDNTALEMYEKLGFKSLLNNLLYNREICNG